MNKAMRYLSDGSVEITKQNHDPMPWQTSRDTRVGFLNLGREEYVFEVQAVDRDLAYSEPQRTQS
jgi:hypothetical protein